MEASPMTEHWFDRLSHAVAGHTSRRQVLGLGVLLAGGLLVGDTGEMTEARPKPEKTSQRGKCRKNCGACEICKRGDCDRRNGKTVCQPGTCQPKADGAPCAGGNCQEGRCIPTPPCVPCGRICCPHGQVCVDPASQSCAAELCPVRTCCECQLHAQPFACVF